MWRGHQVGAERGVSQERAIAICTVTAGLRKTIRESYQRVEKCYERYKRRAVFVFVNYSSIRGNQWLPRVLYLPVYIGIKGWIYWTEALKHPQTSKLPRRVVVYAAGPPLLCQPNLRTNTIATKGPPVTYH